MTNEIFEKICAAVEKQAKALNAEVFEVYYSGSEGLSAETFRDELAGFSAGTDGSLIIRLSVGGKTGCAAGTLVTPEEAEKLVSMAAENALLIEKKEETVFCEGGQTYKKVAQVPFTMPSAAEIKEAAMALRNAGYASSPLISDGTAGCSYASSSEVRFYSSKGLNLSSSCGNCGGYVYSVLEKGEEKRDGFESDFGSLSDLKPEELAKKATEKAEERFGAEVPASGKYPIVFEGKQMQQILSTYLSVFFAKEAQLGTSRLKGKEGEKIANEALTIMDDPYFEGNPMQIPFDGEGTPTYTKAVIEKGVLKTLLYNLETGKKAGKPSTGNGSRGSSSIGTKVFNFYIVPGKYSREELFKKAEGGIFVTGMKGFHAGANVVSGDFSIESEGFMIENGKKGKPIKSFTVSGNFFEMLNNISVIGDTIERQEPGYTRILSPDILLENVPVAGK